MKTCLNCNIIFKSKDKCAKFCGHSCSATYCNNLRLKNGFKQNGEKISKTLKDRYRVKKIIPHNAAKFIKLTCLTCKKEFTKNVRKKDQKYCSSQCVNTRLITDRSPWKNLGGYRKGSGRGKSGWYKGYFCDSSWELAFIIYNLEHNISFTRNKTGFDYIYNNKTHKYYPDFIINNEYIEIKGFMTDKDKEKLEQFPHKITVICKEKIKPYLQYVTDKYGKDYIKLYE